MDRVLCFVLLLSFPDPGFVHHWYFDRYGGILIILRHFVILVIIVIATVLVVNTCQGHIGCQTLNQVFTRIPLFILTATPGSRQNY